MRAEIFIDRANELRERVVNGNMDENDHAVLRELLEALVEAAAADRPTTQEMAKALRPVIDARPPFWPANP